MLASNDLNFNLKMIIGDSVVSDHNFMILNCELPTLDFDNSKHIKLLKTDIESVVNKYPSNMGEQNFRQFHTELCELVNENSKEISIIKYSAKQRNPWFNSELKELKRLRDKYYKDYKRYPSNLSFLNKFLEAKLNLQEKIIEVKRNYNSNLVEANKGNTRKMWQIANDLSKIKKKKNEGKIKLLDEHGIELSNDSEVAEAFAEHYAEQGSSERLFEKPERQLRVTAEEPLSQFRETNEVEINKIIDSLRNNSSTGYDNISTKLLKSLKNRTNFSGKLVIYINDIFRNGTYPDCMKIGKVIPIYKKGDRRKRDNYRMITVLPNINKIIEKCMYERLYEYLENKNILNKKQYGFRKKSSTTYAVLNFYNEVYKGLAAGKKVGAIFIDISRAFDSLDHNELIKELEEIGITGNALKLMESYIRDRRIIVQCNNTKSRSRIINAGVPQGSVLGSLLYIIFKNTIFQQNFEGKIQLYADDIAIVYTTSSYREMKRQMIADMLLIKEWMYGNKLEINAEKTKFLLFNTKNTNEITFNRLIVDDEEFSRVDTFELLGMKVDANLNFSDHIQKVKSKIVPIIALIGRLRGHVREEILKMLYFSHVNSHLMYMLQVYRSAMEG
jgi:hypothetical protein